MVLRIVLLTTLAYINFFKSSFGYQIGRLSKLLFVIYIRPQCADVFMSLMIITHANVALCVFIVITERLFNPVVYMRYV